MKAEDVMIYNPVCLNESDTVRSAAAHFREYDIDGAPVINGFGMLVGTLSTARMMDVIRDGLPGDTPVRHVMLSLPLSADISTPLKEIVRQDREFLLINDHDGKLVGATSRTRLVQILYRELEAAQARLAALEDQQAAGLKVVQESNKDLDDIIDSVSEGLYITDGEANTLRINKAYTRLTGVKPEEVIGKNMRELVANGLYSESVALRVLECRKPVNIIHEVKGNIKRMVTGNPIFNDKGGITLIVMTSRDMTALNRLKEKLEQAEKISRKYQLELKHLRNKQMQADIVANSIEMQQMLELAYKAAQVDSTVLILGETGVGKEVVARYIHKNGLQPQAPFINVNCAAIPDGLLESEMFGYEKGAFTGARNMGKPGLFELAHTGTIFLDEIGDLPLNLQAKLLSVVQDKEVTRVGGTKPRKMDVRILAASNRNLEDLVKAGSFREDLYYRLNVIPVRVPPLRSRSEDIPFLVDYFLTLFNRKYNRSKIFSHSAIDILMQYNWPGNVRELKNLIEQLIVIGNGDEITPDHLINLGEGRFNLFLPDRSLGKPLLRDAVSALEKQLVSRALAKHGSTRKAARALGVSQPTLIRKAHKYGMMLSG